MRVNLNKTGPPPITKEEGMEWLQPVQWYHCRVVSVRDDLSSKKGNTGVSYLLEGLDSPGYTNATFWMTAAAMYRYAKFAIACGYDGSLDDFPSEWPVGKYVSARVTEDKDRYGTVANEFDIHTPPPGTTPTPPPQVEEEDDADDDLPF